MTAMCVLRAIDIQHQSLNPLSPRPQTRHCLSRSPKAQNPVQDNSMELQPLHSGPLVTRDMLYRVFSTMDYGDYSSLVQFSMGADSMGLGGMLHQFIS